MASRSGASRSRIVELAVVVSIAGGLCCCGSSGGSQATSGARNQIQEVSTAELKGWMAEARQFTLIDVREDDEWQAGHAATALHIPRRTLSSRISSAVPDRSARVILYCQGGVRSSASAAALQKMGYTNVFSLAGGFADYQLAGLPVQR